MYMHSHLLCTAGVHCSPYSDIIPADGAVALHLSILQKFNICILSQLSEHSLIDRYR